MAHKIENLRLKNSNGEQLSYTTIIFMDAEEFEATKAKTTVKTGNAPLFGQYYTLLNGLFEEYIEEGDFLSYAKPIITGLTSNADILTVSNNMAYAFATALPQIFEPFGPFKAGSTDNEFIINGHRYAFFGGRGTNEAGDYTLASSFYRYTNPIPDATSVNIFANNGTIVQSQQGSNIFAYFIFCKVSDLDTPWTTITDYGVLKCGLYYGGSGSTYASKYLFLNNMWPATGDIAGKAAFIADLNGSDPDDHFQPGEEDDPSEPGGTSTQGGGHGTFDTTSDTIGVPSLSGLLSATDTGLLTIYNPTLNEVKSLANFMWNASPGSVEFWKKLVADPLDLVIGFSILPCSIPNGGRQSIKVGYIDTEVACTLAASQYVEVDCGTLNIQEFWGSALDFSNYTKIQLFLPYIGFVSLDTDDLMGRVMGIKYHIDILTGSFTCFITVDGSVHYQYLGQCAQMLPLNAQNFSQMISAALGIVSTAFSTDLSSGGAAAAITGMANIAQNVMNLKPTVRHSGSISGSGAFLGVQKPFLLAERPRQSLPENYKHYSGYPSNITETLGNLKGYTEVESVHLHDIPATSEELQLIEDYLKSGVVIS